MLLNTYMQTSPPDRAVQGRRVAWHPRIHMLSDLGQSLQCLGDLGGLLPRYDRPRADLQK